MTQFLFVNNAATTLAGPIAASATSLNLAAGTGALFPNPGVGQQFAMTLVSQSDSNQIEIVYCTARSTDTCTIIRGQESTGASPFIAGDFVSNDLTAGTCGAFIQTTQLQTQATNYGVDTGSANNYVISLNPAPASLAALVGTAIRVNIAHSNTGPSTLTVNNLPSTTIVGVSGTALTAGQIAAHTIATFIFDGTSFECQSFSVAGGALVGSYPNPALAAGAAATNLGTAGGVLAGSYPNPGMAAGAAVANIGFTPIQQGGGAGQTGTKLQLGYDGVSQILAAAGGVNLGALVLRALFNITATGTDNALIAIPGQAGTMIYIQIGTVSINNPGTGIAISQNFALANAFPTSFVAAIAGFLGNNPPSSGSVSAQPFDKATITIGCNGNLADTYGVVYIAIGI